MYIKKYDRPPTTIKPKIYTKKELERIRGAIEERAKEYNKLARAQKIK